MGLPIPDEVMVFMKEHWSEYGLSPVILWRLLNDRKHSYEEVNEALKEAIGPDFNEINIGVWIDRLEAAGNQEMIHSLEFDEPPVLDILDHIVIAYKSKK